MDNKKRYNNIIMEVFEVDLVDESMTRENTEKWDSLVHLTFVTAIEDEFEIMLETEDILNLKSYSEGLNIINKYCS
ncbi:MAG: acyl carrier protein [Lachnospiraceae bacterium]|jgi:acyl carrier protein|nr:acyl carrier protein [Lachnospiraceae bacterium]